jgi:hypothetical protein
MIKSPFFVEQDFISPKYCEQLIEWYKITRPSINNQNGQPLPIEREMVPHIGQTHLFNRLKEYIPSIKERYDANYRGTEPMVMQYYPENSKALARQPGCENAKFVKKKWIKSKDVDLTGVIWLKDYQDQLPIDLNHEVYGGKLEFPIYNFSFVPMRGTLLLFPAGPHFVNAISPILVGDAYQIKINIALSDKETDGLWLYDPKKFPCGDRGFIEGWFNDLL